MTSAGVTVGLLHPLPHHNPTGEATRAPRAAAGLGSSSTTDSCEGRRARLTSRVREGCRGRALHSTREQRGNRLAADLRKKNFSEGTVFLRKLQCQLRSICG